MTQENLLCQYNKEIDDFSSNNAIDNISDHQAQAPERAQDRDRDKDDDYDVEGNEEEDDNKLGAEGTETDTEVNRYIAESSK